MHGRPVAAHRLILPDAAATRTLGESLGRTAQVGDLLLLAGPLGAGKTTLAQGLAQGLGLEDRVTSPTFALIHEYREGRIPLFHFDLYRLNEADLLAQGLTDYWERPEGLCVLEWPERLGNLSLPSHLTVALEPADGGRMASLAPQGPRAAAWLESLHARR